MICRHCKQPLVIYTSRITGNDYCKNCFILIAFANEKPTRSAIRAEARAMIIPEGGQA